MSKPSEKPQSQAPAIMSDEPGKGIKVSTGQISSHRMSIDRSSQPLGTPDITSLQRIRQVFAQPVLASFVAGGVAGAVSRTVVSPLERLKILFQVQSVGREEYKMSVPKALAKMWREEGWRGFMAGNGTNCIRIVPYSAVQFSAYNVYKRVSHYSFLQRLFFWFLASGLLHELCVRRKKVREESERRGVTVSWEGPESRRNGERFRGARGHHGISMRMMVTGFSPISHS
ncbi:mitochondrial carrier [Alternaria alternata]|nr:mitochondrial carrier [Alternaria alternata]